MARLGTPNLGLGTWLDNEYPGAGSQTVPNTGLNGNWLILDTSVGLEHNADGSHKANVIKGSNLVQSGANSTVDGATVEFNANKIRVKANGLNGTHLNQTAGQTVDGSTLEFNSNAIRVKSGGIAAAQLATDAVETAKIKNANITTEKLEYKEYVALVSQSGTGNPAVTVLKNTLGVTLTPTRQSAGLYRLSGNVGTFRQDKVVMWLAGGGVPFFYTLTVNDVNLQYVYVTTYNSAGTQADGYLSIATLIIRVYP